MTNLFSKTCVGLVYTLLFLGILSPAFAGGPISLFNSGTPNLWGGGTFANFPITYLKDQGPLGPLSNNQADAITIFTMNEWDAISTSTFSAIDGGDTPFDITSTNAENYLMNFHGAVIDVVYDNDGSICAAVFGCPPGVLGLGGPTFTGTTVPEIAAAMVLMNGATIHPSDVNGTAFRVVFSQEVGHAIGLHHDQTNGAVSFFGDESAPTGCPSVGTPGFSDFTAMYPFASVSPTGPGAEAASINHPEDLDALSRFHPVANYSTTTGTITGTVFQSDGITPVNGVNVIARSVTDPFGDARSTITGDLSFSTGDAFEGTFVLTGLSPGTNYTLAIDNIVDGAFPKPPAPAFTEEYWNSTSESGNASTDNPCDLTPITASAGTTITADFIMNAPDTTSPTVTINQAAGQSDPTNATTINFTAVFSEPVTDFANGDVTLGGNAGATTTTVTETLPNDGTTYNVAVFGMNANGTVTATLNAGVASDAAGNGNLASTSTDNEVTFSTDTTGPTVTIEQAVGQADPTNAPPINFTVLFNEPVNDFATGDVTLSGTAGATTGTVTETAPTDGTTYNVAVTGMTTPGTVIATIPVGMATDSFGNDNNASTSTDNTVTFELLHVLSVTVVESGTVTSDVGGIDCPTTSCGTTYKQGTKVTLTAQASPGFVFTGWSGGGCSGTSSCQVTMNQPESVVATFTPLPPATLTIILAGDGTGTVTSSPPGIDCGSDCSESYTNSTVVTLNAIGDSGSLFAGWTGGLDCHDGVVTVLSPTDCTAIFVLTDITTRVSVDSTGIEANDQNEGPSISSDGRYVAFSSTASNLVQGDTNGQKDIFVHDRQTGLTARVSLTSTGEETDGSSSYPQISANGQFVAFQSSATNIVPNDTNEADDIFVFDRHANKIERVSLTLGEDQADGESVLPAISANGQHVVFASLATNLVGGDNNAHGDVFLRDRATGNTSLISSSKNGERGNDWSSYPAISGDGRWVTYRSLASNLVDNDTNNQIDVFLLDRFTRKVTRVNVSSTGEEANDKSDWRPAISADGRWITFESWANNLVSGDANNQPDIFLHDRQTGSTSIISVDSSGIQGIGSSHSPAISADGRFITFHSASPNLIPADTNLSSDIFFHDTQTGQTTGVSVNNSGVLGNGESASPSLSANGKYVVYHSLGNNLVQNDNNSTQDIFVHERDGEISPPQSFTVNIFSSPVYSGGSGTVTSDIGTINCPSTCTNEYPLGSIVTITGQPNPGSTFFWEGGQICFGSTPCTISILKTESLTALFIPLEMLNVEFGGNGTGKITSIPGSIDCPGKCQDNFERWSSVKLYVQPDPGSAFTGSPNMECTQFDCEIILDTSYTVTVNFEPAQEISVSLVGSGRGSIVSNGGVINCPARCNGEVGQGTALTLSAIPDSKSVFTGWSGGGCSGVSPCQLTMTTAQHVEATFSTLSPTPPPWQLSINKIGEGGGTISSTPSGINCGSDCSEIYSDPAAITFTPIPEPGSYFSGWMENGPCRNSILHMSKDTTCTAVFSLLGNLTLIKADNAAGDYGTSSFYSSMTPDGRFIAFSSSADDLVENDTNRKQDIFVFDRQIGTFSRVNVSSSGRESNASSSSPSISADGRFVAFVSSATTLVPNDTNATGDIFVHDRQTGITTRINLASDGSEANEISLDPVISANGQYVAFSSRATNLVPNDTNNVSDVFVYEQTTGSIDIVSINSSGEKGNNLSSNPDLSADGRWIAFRSRATNLVPDDTNDKADIFVQDRLTRTTSRVSVSSNGLEGTGESFWDPKISADGNWISFDHSAPNLVSGDTNSFYDIFVHNLQNGTTSRVSVNSFGDEGNGSSHVSDISADGRFIVYESTSNNLNPIVGDSLNHIFLHDRQTGLTTQLDAHNTGDPSNNYSQGPTISADGRFVAFFTNVWSGDLLTDPTKDFFLLERAGSISPPQTLSISIAGNGVGTVSSTPLGINCGTTCSKSYLVGTLVTLTASPDPGTEFVGWSGGGCSGNSTCQVTMTQAHNVTAAFFTDTVNPTVTIDQSSSQADPTNTSPINFTVVFSEPVTGFTDSDVTFGGTANPTTASVNEIAPNDGTTYNVAVTGMNTNGVVTTTIAANVAIDSFNNGNAASTSSDNTVTYSTDTTGPTVSIEQASGQADPTNASPINFTVVFSEPVSDFRDGDVTLSGTANPTSASINEIAPNDGTTYNVAVTGMNADGVLTASIPAGVAMDSFNNGNTASTSSDNTVAYSTDTTGPSVTIDQASLQLDPTNTSPINFTAVFSEPVSDFATGDVILGGTAGATTATVTGSGTTYNVAVGGTAGAYAWDGNSWADYSAFMSPITSNVKANLQSIMNVGVTNGRILGRMGQIGDSITNSSAYFRNGILQGPSNNETSHDYSDVRSWMAYSGTQPANGSSFYNAHGKAAAYGNQSGWKVSDAINAGHPSAAVEVGDGITPGQFSWVLIMYGTNDIDNQSWDALAWKAEYMTFIQGFINLGVIPVLSTIPPEQTHIGDGRVELANEQIKALADQLNIPFVDYYALVLHYQPVNWVGTLIGSDGTHPTAGGGGRNFSQNALTTTDGYAARTKLTWDMAEKLKAIVFENGNPEDSLASNGIIIATIAAGVATDSFGNGNSASTSTDNEVTFSTDTTGPTVTIEQAAGQSDPTNASPINFTVLFSEPVSDFISADVIVTGAGATTAIVTGTGTTYNVAVSDMTTDGVVSATIPANVATDSFGNGNSASTSTDNEVTFSTDTTGPTVTIEQAAGQSDPTNAGPVNFTVLFSEVVTDFATGDVTLSGTAGATTAIVTGSGTTYNVAVSGMTITGTVIASVDPGVATDSFGNANSASTSTDNEVTFILDAPPPPPPASVTLTFQEGVNGFVGTQDTYLRGSNPTSSRGKASLFSWTTSGEQSAFVQFDNIIGPGPDQIPVGATIDSATLTIEVYDTGNAPEVYDVTVPWSEADTFNSFGGEPGVQPDELGALVSPASGLLPLGPFAIDVTTSVANWVSGANPNHGWLFNPVGSNRVRVRSSEYGTASARPQLSVTYHVSTASPGPTVTINQAVGQADPSNAAPLNFTVAFSEPVSDFTTGDVIVTGAGATTATVTGSGTIYNVAVTGMTTDGVVSATIAAGVATDSTGNPSSASTSTDNAITFSTDTTGPSVTLEQASGQSDPTNASPINFTVVFSEPVTDFATGDVIVTGGGATTATVTGSGTTYNVAVTGMTTDGIVSASLAAGVATDSFGNGNSASTSTDNTVIFSTDITGPSVTLEQASGQSDPTNASPVNFTVLFSEVVTDFATGDVTLGGTAGATTATVTGSGTTYNVAVTGMTTEGVVSATIAAGVATDSWGNANSASTSTDNDVIFDATSPTVTLEQANGQSDPTNASPVNFTVLFSEVVTDFATDDVTLGGTAGATTATVTGSGTTYNVAVTGMTTDGTVSASLAAGVATDGLGNFNSASTSTDNTVIFSSDTTGPTITLEQANGQNDPTNASPVNFTVLFSEVVTDFTTGDVTLGGTAGATTATVTGSGTTYNVAVSGMTTTGTITANVAAGIAVDSLGNSNSASTSTDNEVTFNLDTPPPASVTLTFQEGENGFVGTQDNYIRGSNPNSSRGQAPLFSWTTSGEQSALVQFDNIIGPGLDQIPVGATIESAMLRIEVYDTGDAPEVYEVTVPWTEADSYNSFGGEAGVQPDELGALVSPASGQVPSGPFEIDVTTSVANWVRGANPNHGWLLRPVASNRVRVRSSEYGTTSVRPRLSVTFTP